MADSSTQMGRTVTASVASHGGSPSTSHPATPSTSKKAIRKLASWFQKPFSRSKGREAEPTATSAGLAQDQNPQATPTTVPDTLLVRTESIHLDDDTISPARKVAGYNLAIAVIDIFQPVVECTDIVLPTPVGKVLEQLTKVLGVLKQMVENRESWKELLLTLVDHRDQFNEQLVLMKQDTTKPDADSPVLAPLKGYSKALEKLAAKIILESGFVQQNSIGDAGWDRIKKFTTKYIGVEYEKLQIETYRQELRDAMQMLSQRLGLYVAFTVGHINVKLDSNPTGYPIPRKRVVAKRPPEVSPYYVARDKEWKYLVHNLIDSMAPGRKILAITGMGGCGKTQLVSYFLKQNKGLFTHVVYVDASSTSTIKADLGAWAQSLGDGHEQDDWENALDLITDERWAYILDNADDPELVLRPFIPKSSDGTILITSRNRRVANLTTYHLEMGEMTGEEALSVLMKAARRESPLPAEERDSADTLMKELGWLALALVHVGTYCHELSSGDGEAFTFTLYLKRFRSNRAALMKQAGPATIDGYELGVYTSLDLSYQKLPQSAKELLRLISNFHYSDIPTEMLATAAEKRFDDPSTYLARPEEHSKLVSRLSALLGTSRSTSEFQVESVIPTLRSFSLVSTTFIDGSLFLRIHPLVQAWARDMESQDAADYGFMAVQILTCCSIDSNINMYRHLLPHISERFKDERDSSLHVNDQIAFGRVLLKMGRYEVAEVLFREALKSLQQSSREETENSLWITGYLAMTHSAQGRYDDAEKLGLEVLEKRKKILGTEHLDTILAAGNLARTYSAQGRHDEAETLELEVLEKRRRILGAEHPDTILAAGNLASTYADQGRYDDAEKLGLEVLEKRKKILGTEHLDTILAVGNLASTYSDQGRYDKAEALKLEVLERRRKILGTEHPDTVMAAANLARTYSARGRHDDAKMLELEVLEKRRRILGTKHPATIRTTANLARTYSAQGRYGEAEMMELEVLEKFKKILGTEHPDTILAAGNLASTYSDQGRHDKAEVLKLEVLEKRRKVLGTEHPGTIKAAGNLAHTYSAQGRYDEAETLELEVLEKRRKILGTEHPDTIMAAANLARTYSAQGRYNEAEMLEFGVLEKRKNILGTEHPDTILAGANLASTYADQGRHDEAEKLELEVLEKQRKILGTEHPRTIRASANLACTYSDQGRYDEAETLELEVLEKRRNTLGTEHPDTILAAGNLARTYFAQGRYDAAETLELEVLEKRRRVLGLHHPRTGLAAANLASTYRFQGRLDDADRLEAHSAQKAAPEPVS